MPALVAQLPTLAAMFFVCAFGSCLDVAAIQADMETPIDFDAELTTAGVTPTIMWRLKGVGLGVEVLPVHCSTSIHFREVGITVKVWGAEHNLGMFCVVWQEFVPLIRRIIRVAGIPLHPL